MKLSRISKTTSMSNMLCGGLSLPFTLNLKEWTVFYSIRHLSSKHNSKVNQSQIQGAIDIPEENPPNHQVQPLKSREGVPLLEIICSFEIRPKSLVPNLPPSFHILLWGLRLLSNNHVNLDVVLFDDYLEVLHCYIFDVYRLMSTTISFYHL